LELLVQYIQSNQSEGPTNHSLYKKSSYVSLARNSSFSEKKGSFVEPPAKDRKTTLGFTMQPDAD